MLKKRSQEEEYDPRKETETEPLVREEKNRVKFPILQVKNKGKSNKKKKKGEQL